MQKDIKNFIQQFNFQPSLENPNDQLSQFQKFIVAGMGGSHLAADLIKDVSSPSSLIIHSNYELPALGTEELSDYLFIASSYSGNTEETLDALQAAQKNKMAIAVISAGGKLLEIAQKENLPYIQLPSGDIQPRLAVGYSLIAMLTLMRHSQGLKEVREMDSSLFGENLTESGQSLAQEITEHGLIPLIYSTKQYPSLTYLWKINLNETGKIPTFSNVFPELNHNEMQGFEILTRNHLYEKFLIIMLRDPADHPANLKRMELTRKIYEDLGLKVTFSELKGKNYWEKVLSSVNLSQWTSFHIAQNYGVEPEQVNLVEKFKKMLK